MMEEELNKLLAGGKQKVDTELRAPLNKAYRGSNVQQQLESSNAQY